jgi:hypothetical protein
MATTSGDLLIISGENYMTVDTGGGVLMTVKTPPWAPTRRKVFRTSVGPRILVEWIRPLPTLAGRGGRGRSRPHTV